MAHLLERNEFSVVSLSLPLMQFQLTIFTGGSDLNSGPSSLSLSLTAQLAQQLSFHQTVIHMYKLLTN